MNRYPLQDLLPAVNPALLTYQEWVNVGFVMRDEGMSASDWEAWSASDARHKPGECLKKWRSFGRNTNGVTVGTVVEYARRQGWTPPGEAGHELGWNDEIRDDHSIVDKNWLEDKAINEPDSATWDQKGEIIRYLESLFESTDLVGYVTETWDKDGKHLPTKGAFDRTAGELIAKLQKCKDISDVIGTVKPEVGAWIRFNPLDGHDVTNANVTDYRYALVESDSMSLEKQYAMMTELNLPIKILVSSGGKSLHAIVRIDAGSMEEYRKRVDYLYNVCRKNGMEIDQANRNPSRLSRMPGVYRNGRKQFIIAENIGCKTFGEWQEWVEAANDDLPDAVHFEDLVRKGRPEYKPAIIEGILRKGHKLLTSGPSKAGKSFAMIELAVAIATGTRWINWKCEKGKVWYINLELDEDSCTNRFFDVCEAMGMNPASVRGLDMWNLRGRGMPLDKLTPALIRRAIKEHYDAIIIDPIYKVLTGDENNAEQMSRFCSYFDRISVELGTAVIYCHHHSKGAQGGKKAMDRASGSGVFARDPDAQIDLVQLELTESVQVHMKDEAAKAEIINTLTDILGGTWVDDMSIDDQFSRKKLMTYAAEHLPAKEHEELSARIAESERLAMSKTAWRIECTLREFASPPPLNCWFDYPIHRVDEVGILKDMEVEQAQPSWKKGAQRSKSSRQKKVDKNVERFASAVNNAKVGEPVTLSDVINYLSPPAQIDESGQQLPRELIPRATAERWMKKAGYKIDKNTHYIVLDEDSPK